MTTRRTFITGLLASAATGAAPPVPAQPVADLRATLAPWFLQSMGRINVNAVYGKPGILSVRVHQDQIARWLDRK